MSPVDETPDLLDDLIRAGAPSHIVKRVAKLLAADEALNERRAKDAARKAEKRSENKASPQTSEDVRGHVGQARKSSLREGVRAEPETTLSEENTSKKESKSTTPAASRGTRIPDGFLPDIAAAVAEGLPQAEAEREAEKFRDWWSAAPGSKGLKANWPATWRTWFRKRIEERAKTGPPGRAGNGTGFNGKPTLGDIRNAALAAIAARDANGRPNLELLAGPDRRPGTGNGDNRPPDGVPRPSDGPDSDRGDLLRGLLRVRAFPG